MKKLFVLLTMVLGVIPCLFAEITVQTKVFDANSQPPIVGGVIGDYSEDAVVEKGILVSINSGNLFYNTQSEKYNPHFYEDPSTPNDTYNSLINKEFRIIDCSAIGKNQFWCPLLLLKSSEDYYVRAYVVKTDGSVIYGQIESLQSQSFNRYNGRGDYANVWHAFENTLFDLVTDEIINPQDGFYYSTNENPKTVRHQVGTGYNTCYKFATEWNYKLWYYHSGHSDKSKQTNPPVVSFANGKLTIEKNPLDVDKDISIYYCINGNYFRPETYTDVYTTPLEITEPCAVYCYAISSEGYISYTNMYIVGEYIIENEDNDDKKLGIVADVVDLGLSVKWASWNMGASSVGDYGGLYGAGDPTGLKTSTSYADYYWKDGESICGTEYDLAHVKWGGNWRMPSWKELEELQTKCEWSNGEVDGVKGSWVKGPNGNSIFLPWSGNRNGESTFTGEGSVGYYWSGDMGVSLHSYGYQDLDIDETGVWQTDGAECYWGQSIRPVYAESTNETFGTVADVVDLGLSVKWASWNMGASSVGDYGGLYGAGDPTGLKTSTSYTDYYWKDGESICGTEYDLAHVKWGGNWRMPSWKELEELQTKCEWSNGEVDGVKGSWVKGPNGNSIFLPWSGNRNGESTFTGEGSVGYYWSGDMGVSLHSYGYQDLDIDETGVWQTDGAECYWGQSIRPVYVESTNETFGTVADVVDLGLSVKWASWNVGADKPEGLGNLYAWGELSPKTDYSTSTYKFYNSSYTKYGSIDNKYHLDAEDDVAKQKWGGNWRMPTFEELKELKEKCTFTETTLNGVPVTKVVGPNGNYIYLPYPGNFTGTSRYFENSVGSYWSSNLESDSYAKDIDFTSGIPSLNGDSRYHGQAIRPVYEDNVEPFDKVPDVVDLGLSSGTLWATCNIGASSPEEYGDYFAWGETTPKSKYDWNSYKFGNGSSFSKYNSADESTELELEDDAAYVILGKDWRMPTHIEELELVNECSWESVNINGISGYIITGPNGNSIFMPRGGLYDGTDYDCDGTKLSSVNYGGWYWSSTLNAKGSAYAQGLCFFPSLLSNVCDHERCDGHNIRPVYVGKGESLNKAADIVDLGLSVKWASWNVGAEKPEGLGSLYAWGEITPKNDYSSSNYKFYDNSYTKYGTVDNKYRLEADDDVASQLWGNNWRMPTFEELKELKEKCTFTKTELNGVPVTKVTGPNGNFIYFPYPGNYTGKTLYYENSIGSYWSSDLETDSYAQDIDYIGGMPSLNGDTRYHGQAVRPVYDEATSTKRVIHLESAGTLAQKISTTESGEILDLKITGHMDARDFDFIKWHCMKVENVDLSGVKIEAYSGSDGTNEGYDYTYAANEIPLGAFFYWISSYKYKYEGMPSDEGMPSLKKIILPDGIKAIRRNAFARAYNLTEINIPEGVETIDYVAFAVCTSLAEITLPSSLREVGTTTFADMTSLRTVNIYATNPPTCSNDAFMNLSNDAVLFVPKGTKSLYQSANGWKSFSTIMEIGEIEQVFEVEGIKYRIGENNTVSVTSRTEGYSGDVVIPTHVSYNGITYSVMTIETNAFNGSNNLQVLILPQAIYNTGIPESIMNFVTYSKNPMRVEVKSKGATSAILNIDPLNEKGCATITMLGLTPGQIIKWKLDDENYGIISDKTESTLTLTVQPAQPTNTTKARLTAIVNEADDDLHYGFEWLRNDAPEGMPSNVVSVPLHDGRIVGSLGGLNPDVYYKYRPFYKSDSGELTYGAWIPFLTGDANVFFEPETHTKEATELTQMSALLAAVWVEGTEDILEKGFEFWPLNIIKTRAAGGEVSKVIVSGNKTTATIEGLTANTEYGFRSYVKTASATTYGEEMTFMTNLTGDVNGDGNINQKDVDDLVNHIMHKTPINFNEKMADINNDGKINVADVTALIPLVPKQ